MFLMPQMFGWDLFIDLFGGKGISGPHLEGMISLGITEGTRWNSGLF